MHKLQKKTIQLIGGQTREYAQATAQGWVWVTDINLATTMALDAACTLKLTCEQHNENTAIYYDII